MTQRIVLASSNSGKLKEFGALLADSGLEVVPQASLGIADAEETGLTFVENALHKARHAAQASGLPALADDSGLCVDALDGRPGVYSARYAPTDKERIAKLLGELKKVPAEKRTAAFVCAMALVLPDGRMLTVEGRRPGMITDGPRGEHGFGYDPVFLVPETGKTFAELSADEKNRLSHRAIAAEKLKAALQGATIR
jgi:XTP/dITP diphosphohydrolase